MESKKVLIKINPDEVFEGKKILFIEPVCANAIRFCRIAKTNQLDIEQLYDIQKLGFEIEIVKE